MFARVIFGLLPLVFVVSSADGAYGKRPQPRGTIGPAVDETGIYVSRDDDVLANMLRHLSPNLEVRWVEEQTPNASIVWCPSRANVCGSRSVRGESFLKPMLVNISKIVVKIRVECFLNDNLEPFNASVEALDPGQGTSIIAYCRYGIVR